MTGLQDGTAPQPLPDGELTVVAASVLPDDDSLILELLYPRLSPEDSVILVSVDRPPAAVVEEHEREFAGPSSPSLGIVDTSADQTFKDTYHGVSVVGTLGVEDLTRTTIAVSDLAAESADRAGDVHLVVPDLSSFLARTSLDRLRRAVDSLVDDGSVSGAVVVGVDYTAHSTETVSTLLDDAAAVVWTDRRPDGSVSTSIERSDDGRDRDRL